MEVGNWLVSWFMTYLRDLQPTYVGAVMQLLSIMDIPVGGMNKSPQDISFGKGRILVKYFLSLASKSSSSPENTLQNNMVDVFFACS